jgi:hypothetical protein
MEMKMPDCFNHDEHDICTECGFGLSYYFTKEERLHLELEHQVIEANLESWRKSYQKDRAR